jgi:hypothetical protein
MLACSAIPDIVGGGGWAASNRNIMQLKLKVSSTQSPGEGEIRLSIDDNLPLLLALSSDSRIHLQRNSVYQRAFLGI